MIIIGLDPGASGGMAVLGDCEVTTLKFDTMTPREIYDELWDLSLLGLPVKAYLEKVHGMPGCRGQFEFGVKYGWLQMALIAARIPFELVPPQTWQRGVGMAGLKGEKADRKRQLKARAQELFPSIKVTLSDADALLIAEYGRRKLRGE